MAPGHSIRRGLHRGTLDCGVPCSTPGSRAGGGRCARSGWDPVRMASSSDGGPLGRSRLRGTGGAASTTIMRRPLDPWPSRGHRSHPRRARCQRIDHRDRAPFAGGLSRRSPIAIGFGIRRQWGDGGSRRRRSGEWLAEGAPPSPSPSDGPFALPTARHRGAADPPPLRPPGTVGRGDGAGAARRSRS